MPNPFLHIVDNRDIPALHDALGQWRRAPHPDKSDLDGLLLQIADQSGLHRSKFTHLVDMAHMALDAGANINAPGPFGSPLSLAVRRGNVEMVQALIARGAALQGDLSGPLPLVNQAVKSDHRGVFKALVEAGAPVDVRDKRGRTALFEAMAPDLRPFQRLLIKAGADPKIQDEKGCTLWHVLALETRTRPADPGYVRDMKQLLRWGVDPGITDSEGHTPRDVLVAYSKDFLPVFDGFFAELEASKLHRATTASQPTPTRRRPGL